MPGILSTKKLAPNQKELLLNSGISLVEYDAIKISSHDFSIDHRNIPNAIFTSKNAVKALQHTDMQIDNCFCVGEKTLALLEERGYKVVENADNSADLAQKIIQKHSDKHFIFFSGNKRRDELPQLLKTNNISFEEIHVYKTSLNLKKFETEFDGILFFSPSGVESFSIKNQINAPAFCIGKTTAEEARKHTNNVIVASKPTIENVIARVVTYFKKGKNSDLC